MINICFAARLDNDNYQFSQILKLSPPLPSFWNLKHLKAIAARPQTPLSILGARTGDGPVTLLPSSVPNLRLDHLTGGLSPAAMNSLCHFESWVVSTFVESWCVSCLSIGCDAFGGKFHSNSGFGLQIELVACEPGSWGCWCVDPREAKRLSG